MPRRSRSRAAALVAILALLLAVPFERGRGCSVCPIDCPMHAPRRTGHVGCHQGAAPTHAVATPDDGACAMRSSCGHHGGGEVVAFHAELPLVVTTAPPRDVRALAMPLVSLHDADGPPPPDRPPRSSVA